jgi:D-sedoheptulose 7-phosphate isomerase
MRKFIKNYYRDFITLINSIRVINNQGEKLDFYEGIGKVCNLIKSQTYIGNKIIFIGNGGSAAIASHMAIDFWKNGNMKAIAFNDSSLLTCIANDFGYEYVFEKPIGMFAEKGDILFAISSSGRSKNILEGVQAARLKGCNIITLSGFKENNPLSSMGDFNFYVSSQKYGPVEVIHQSICHCIFDTLMAESKKHKL